MQIIIIGAGDIGSYLAKQLSSQGHSICVMDIDKNKVKLLQSILDARVMHAHCTNASTLADAGAATADIIIALTPDTSLNLVACSIAKSMGTKKALCRVEPSVQREEWLFNYQKHFDVDIIFSPERFAAIELAKHVRNPDSIQVEELAKGEIELQQISINESSPWANARLGDLKRVDNTLIASVCRDGMSFVPHANSILKADDIATIVGEPRDLTKLAKLLHKSTRADKTINVIIFGGGEYGLSLAQMIENLKNIRVKLIEKDLERANELVQILASTSIIRIDGTIAEELKEEQIDETDFFIAMSGDDEDNLMSCLQASTLGAKQCLTLIHRTDYANVVRNQGKNFGIIAAVSPKEITAKEVQKYITDKAYFVSHQIQGNDLIEIDIPQGSQLDQQQVQQIEWPQGVVLLGITKYKKSQVPHADSLLEAGQTIHALVEKPALKAFLKIFKA